MFSWCYAAWFLSTLLHIIYDKNFCWSPSIHSLHLTHCLSKTKQTIIVKERLNKNAITTEQSRQIIQDIRQKDLHQLTNRIIVTSWKCKINYLITVGIPCYRRGCPHSIKFPKVSCLYAMKKACFTISTDWAYTVNSRYLDLAYLEKPLISKWNSGPCLNMEI